MAEQADLGGIDLDREALLGVLARHRVAFVLIGGAGIQSHGRRFDTQDIDLTPDTAPENLARLADALNELHCQLITDPADTHSWVTLPSDYFTPRSLLAASVWNLATGHGQLDLCFTPAGFPGGYRDLQPRATERRPLRERPSSWPSPRSRTSTSPSARPIDPRTVSTSNAPKSPTHRCAAEGVAQPKPASDAAGRSRSALSTGWPAE